jgi:hypothetical protein
LTSPPLHPLHLRPFPTHSSSVHEEGSLERDLQALEVCIAEIQLLQAVPPGSLGLFFRDEIDAFLVNNGGGEASALGDYEVVDLAGGTESLDVVELQWVK